MPPGTVSPFVMRFDTGSVPVGYLVLSSETKTIGEIRARSGSNTSGPSVDSADGAAAYHEMNFAPSGAWAATFATTGGTTHSSPVGPLAAEQKLTHRSEGSGGLANHLVEQGGGEKQHVDAPLVETAGEQVRAEHLVTPHPDHRRTVE